MRATSMAARPGRLQAKTAFGGRGEDGSLWKERPDEQPGWAEHGRRKSDALHEATKKRRPDRRSLAPPRATRLFPKPKACKTPGPRPRSYVLPAFRNGGRPKTTMPARSRPRPAPDALCRSFPVRLVPSCIVFSFPIGLARSRRPSAVGRRATAAPAQPRPCASADSKPTGVWRTAKDGEGLRSIRERGREDENKKKKKRRGRRTKTRTHVGDARTGAVDGTSNRSTTLRRRLALDKLPDSEMRHGHSWTSVTLSSRGRGPRDGQPRGRLGLASRSRRPRVWRPLADGTPLGCAPFAHFLRAATVRRASGVASVRSAWIVLGRACPKPVPALLVSPRRILALTGQGRGWLDHGRTRRRPARRRGCSWPACAFSRTGSRPSIGVR